VLAPVVSPMQGTADVWNKLTASLMLAIIFDHDGRLNADILCNVFKRVSDALIDGCWEIQCVQHFEGLKIVFPYV
jgi:hypothetical protein